MPSVDSKIEKMEVLKFSKEMEIKNMKECLEEQKNQLSKDKISLKKFQIAINTSESRKSDLENKIRHLVINLDYQKKRLNKFISSSNKKSKIQEKLNINLISLQEELKFQIELRSDVIYF